MRAKNETYFRNLKPTDKVFKRSDSGGLYMLVAKNGSKLWRLSYRFGGKQQLLVVG